MSKSVGFEEGGVEKLTIVFAMLEVVRAPKGLDAVEESVSLIV